MKIFRISLLNKEQHVIKAEKLQVVTHKVLGPSILVKINPEEDMFIPVRNIASMVEDDDRMKKAKKKARDEQIDYLANKKEGESKKQYLKRIAKDKK